jgi:PKD repeat protein
MATFVDRIASTDLSYKTGDLSIYPVAKDTRSQLYSVSNNAQTVLIQSASFNSSYFVVEDTSSFPDQGIVMVGTEQVYYDAKSSNSFFKLKRGFTNSRQEQWAIGTPVYGAVTAEPHNAVRDAIINIEKNLGTEDNPDPASLNGLLKDLESRFFAPRPVFRATPRTGIGPLTVTFQNFSEGPTLQFFWDFGDGATSNEFAPTHIYLNDGSYTVTLNVVTVLNAQGIATKNDYIQVGVANKPAFFYFTPSSGTTSTVFNFVDQTDGQVSSRYWNWGDGNMTSVTDPDVHTATHQYSAKGTYTPSLMLVFVDGTKTTISSGSLTVG